MNKNHSHHQTTSSTLPSIDVVQVLQSMRGKVADIVKYEWSGTKVLSVIDDTIRKIQSSKS